MVLLYFNLGARWESVVNATPMPLYPFVAIAFQLCFRVRHYGVHVNQDGLKLNGTHQLPVYADDVNILGRSMHTINKNKEALVVASK